MVAGTCNPSYSRGWGRRIAWTQETEVAVSRDCTTVLQPDNKVRLLQEKKKLKIYFTVAGLQMPLQMNKNYSTKGHNRGEAHILPKQKKDPTKYQILFLTYKIIKPPDKKVWDRAVLLWNSDAKKLVIKLRQIRSHQFPQGCPALVQFQKHVRKNEAKKDHNPGHPNHLKSSNLGMIEKKPTDRCGGSRL